MHWRRKAQVQNVVAAMPMSDAVYFALQRACGSLRRGRTSPLEWLEAAARLVSWAEDAGQMVSGARFLEVGTGRNVNLPIALWLYGAGSVATVDLNTYLSRALVFESLDYLRARRAEVEQVFGARAATEEFKQRYARLSSFRGTLDELLRLASIEYLSPADAAHLPLADHSIDFHVSHAVFEHIPPESLRGILAEARRLLAPTGALIHVIDPSDHFAHDDASITAINFLRFGDAEWRKLAGNKFMFHNRLRSCEYLELFAQAGVRVLRQEESLDEPSLEALTNGFPLHAQFQHMTPRALAVRSLNVMGTFAEAASESATMGANGTTDAGTEGATDFA